MNIAESKEMVSNILVFVLIVGTNAITWSSKLPKKPKEFANKTGCYIREIDDVIAFSDSVNALGFCYLIHCTLTQIDYVSCGVKSDDHDKCMVTGAQFDEPYPKCCPIVKCFEEDIPWQEHKNETTTKKKTKRRNSD